ncbi:hypothetical protein [Nocardioides soli]|uniref:Uncharacterized protein n=1 Tax=Nocardioides soli TaxID=1036020 RepID=A0A7W4W127_9ACTN|nr:hypothetical protein [Nocardioides soli]MBB3044952.1 hypothetical protein [Nocardioides soli]
MGADVETEGYTVTGAGAPTEVGADLGAVVVGRDRVERVVRRTR